VARYILSPEYRDELAREKREHGVARLARQKAATAPLTSKDDQAGTDARPNGPSALEPPVKRCGYCLIRVEPGVRFCSPECRIAGPAGACVQISNLSIQCR
jgi:hypothetical protein